MNPIVKRDQSHRPIQPTNPLSASEFQQCAKIVPQWLSNSAPSVAVLAYLTDTASLHPWVLGLTAAAHGVPLVVAGHGMRWGGAGVKLPATRRAVQALEPHLPSSTTIVFADGTDTAIANAPPAETPAASRSAHAVLVAGECNSWPLCYRDSYARHAAYRQCALRHSPACYPNSGLYAGSASALLHFLSALEHIATDPHLLPPERGDDQAALHRLYLAGGRSGDGRRGGGSVGSGGGGNGGSASARASAILGETHVDVHVDSSRSLFAGLHACKGSGAPRAMRIKGSNFSMCHGGAHEPLVELHRNGTSLVFGTSRGGGGSRGGSNGGGGARQARPLLVHASGNHDRLARAFLGDGYSLQRLGTTGRRLSLMGAQVRTGVERLWYRLLEADSAVTDTGGGQRGNGAKPRVSLLLDHPVLLVDAAGKEACSLSTVGALVPPGRRA